MLSGLKCLSRWTLQWPVLKVSNLKKETRMKENTQINEDQRPEFYGQVKVQILKLSNARQDPIEWLMSFTQLRRRLRSRMERSRSRIEKNKRQLGEYVSTWPSPEFVYIGSLLFQWLVHFH